MNLTEARQRLGLNIKNMAFAMGVHRETWYKWENGVQRIPNAASRLLETLLWLKDKNCLKTYLKKFDVI